MQGWVQFNEYESGRPLYFRSSSIAILQPLPDDDSATIIFNAMGQPYRVSGTIEEVQQAMEENQ